MKQLLNSLFATITRPLLGTNISRYIPFSQEIYRFIFGQLQDDGITQLPYQGNLVISVYNKDTSVGAFLRLKGEYEPTNAQAFIDSIQPGDTVVDIGANIGTFTLLAARAVGEQGQVHVFEPDPENLKLLSKNLADNHFQQVHVVPKAVGDRAGSIHLAVEDKDKGGGQITTAATGLEVEMVTLDDYAIAQHITTIDVLKIDIEGAELLALKGAQQILTKSKQTTLFMEINPGASAAFGHSVDDLLELLQSYGFTPRVLIDEHAGGQLVYERALLDNMIRQHGYVNVVWRKG
jgi:FkbM family methyltransferase